MLSTSNLEARVVGPLAEMLLDAQEPVILRRALPSAGRAELDLAAAERHSEIGDEGVRSLP